MACELDIQERYGQPEKRFFDIIQGGIPILLLKWDNVVWEMEIAPDLHPIVKQDTESFMSDGLKNLLIKAVVTYFDCFTEEKINTKKR